MVRPANVGRALLMTAVLEAVNAWQSGIHTRVLVIGGAGMFVMYLLMFQGFNRWELRQKARRPGPPPPLPPGVPGSIQPSDVDHGGAARG